jgi:hypothetical protein
MGPYMLITAQNGSLYLSIMMTFVEASLKFICQYCISSHASVNVATVLMVAWECSYDLCRSSCRTCCRLVFDLAYVVIDNC